MEAIFKEKQEALEKLEARLGSLGFRHYLGSIVGGAIGGAALGFAGAGVAWLGPAIAGTGSAAAAWGGFLSSLFVSFAGGFFDYSANKWISGDEWNLGYAFIRGGFPLLKDYCSLKLY